MEDTFEALVTPGRALPAFITRLTGITDAMLSSRPRLEQVLPGLIRFVGDLPVLGHNVKFDLGFLQARGLLRYNESLDTFDLASVMLASALRGKCSVKTLAPATEVRLTARRCFFTDIAVLGGANVLRCA